MELHCEKCSKTFCKRFASQNMQNQTNAKYSSNFEDIFKSNKTLKILTLKMTPRTLPHLKFQVKLVSEKSFKLTIQIFHG